MAITENLEHKWVPIELPTPELIAYASAATQQLDHLAKAWAQQRSKLETSSAEGLREFMGRLVRSWAIETGILERIYDLDEGATKTLIEHGFRTDFVERSDSQLEPEQLMAVLTDHQTAAEMVLSLVAENRPLSAHFIRELHQLLTRNQTHTEAMTTSGVRMEVPLDHGMFKRLPNNPMRPDGTIHEYAPPEHVEAEVGRLIAGYAQIEDASIAVQAAWLHHRFTQIHPFQDGNGRVARAITNYVLVKAGLFPLVVHRDARVQYLGALEDADRGDLSTLIDFFAEVQSETTLGALALARDEDRVRRVALDSVVSALADRFGRRIQDRQSVLRGVNSVAEELRDRAASHLRNTADTAVAEFNRVGMSIVPYQDTGGTGSGSEHYWKFQLIEIANELGYWVNFAEGQYWIRVAFNRAPVEFQYVVSLHHVGHELNGVMRASAFIEFDLPDEPPPSDADQRSPRERLRASCTPTLYSFTWQSSMHEAWPALESWLDESFAMALRRWMDLF